MKDLHLGIVGATGQMGQQLLRDIAEASKLSVAGAIARSGRAGEILLANPHLRLSARIDDFIQDCDALIDFSSPAGFDLALKAARDFQIPLVSGTTGLSDEQLNALDDATTRTPILLAANFSVGVTILSELVEVAARATGSPWHIEILEAHHANKADSPSGTAIHLGESAARGRGISLDDHATWARVGQTGPRQTDEIGFQVLRGGSIVGEHTVFFCGAGERIELTHRAQDRGLFARGALRAARWLAEKPPGRYSMRDVLFD